MGTLTHFASLRSDFSGGSPAETKTILNAAFSNSGGQQRSYFLIVQFGARRLNSQQPMKEFLIFVIGFAKFKQTAKLCLSFIKADFD